MSRRDDMEYVGKQLILLGADLEIHARNSGDPLFLVYLLHTSKLLATIIDDINEVVRGSNEPSKVTCIIINGRDVVVTPLSHLSYSEIVDYAGYDPNRTDITVTYSYKHGTHVTGQPDAGTLHNMQVLKVLPDMIINAAFTG